MDQIEYKILILTCECFKKYFKIKKLQNDMTIIVHHY